LENLLTPGSRRIPALDGMRGLAVAGVLAYHCGFGWARGGFLGVSLFFTLSGFLITSLLLQDLRLGRFWTRRARRLLPAATIALAGIVVFGATVATASQLPNLRVDVLSALGYVANWRFVLRGASYGDLWSAPSPVQHFWSLAIEEQLYIALPLAVVAVRGRLRSTAVVLSVALTGTLVAAAIVHGDVLRAYYGS
jgi:peptidoglycan/LPS O-acetylase OafA/YrhL